MKWSTTIEKLGNVNHQNNLVGFAPAMTARCQGGPPVLTFMAMRESSQPVWMLLFITSGLCNRQVSQHVEVRSPAAAAKTVTCSLQGDRGQSCSLVMLMYHSVSMIWYIRQHANITGISIHVRLLIC